MAEISKVEAAVFAAIDEVNEALPENGQIEKAHSAAIFGESGVLDSLGLVNLIVAVEQAIEDEFDESITLADEKAVSQRNSPFRTVGSLIDYVDVLLRGGEE
jgi:acyl carrier protein